MATANAPLYAFNRGEVSPLALGRLDVERLRLSASEQTNWVPRTLGPMSLRPGLQYVTATRGDLPCRVVPFVFSSAQTAALEFTNNYMRVLVDDVVVTRPAVTASMYNVDAPTAWYVRESGGGDVQFVTGAVALAKVAVGGVAKITQGMGIPNVGVEHALTILVGRGPVLLRVGSVLDAEDYIPPTQLGIGWHSLAFVPTTAAAYVEFEAVTEFNSAVYSCLIAPPGEMAVPTPWTQADLPNMRTEQSADVVFVACRGVKQMRIERRSQRSWSVVEFRSSVGPFTSNTNSTITLTPTVLHGEGYIFANAPVFKAGHQSGALIKMTHSGQQVSSNISDDNSFTDPIKVTGVGATRSFAVYTNGTWAGNLMLQRSFDGPDTGYLDFKVYTTATADTISDGLDNSIIWYRIGFKTAEYTSGTASPVLVYASGGGSGVGRILSVQSPTQAYIEILDNFSNTTATADWKLGSWSDAAGWPSAVRLFQGRLWWAGNDRFWGSASDIYDNYDVSAEGEGAAIDRSIGAGPIATINWLADANRLLAGTDMAVIQAKSSSFDEPLTPTAFTLNRMSTQGTANLPMAMVDTRIVFVQQSNRRVYQILFDAVLSDYKVTDLTRLNENIGIGGFTDIAVQRQPDTHIHLPLGDGTCAVLLYDSDDEVEAWWRVQTDGVIENAYVLPGAVEDRVYYVVRRTVNGVTRRYHERFARLDECVGGVFNKQADSFFATTQAYSTTVTGLSHLEGRYVVAWADGKDYSPRVNGVQALHLVTGGAIVLPHPVSNVVVGLPYTGTFVSSKLAYAAQQGTALNQTKRVNAVGLLLANTHTRGLRFKANPTNEWEELPRMEDGVPVGDDAIWTEYDKEMHVLPGAWDSDCRLVLEAQAPRPATVMAAVISVTTMG